MKLLISAGEKTDRLVDGVAKKFVTGGIDFLTVKYLTEIDNIYSRGEYFDKAILIEQCWTDDGDTLNESEFRHVVNAFAESAANRGNRLDYVFLVQSKEMAAIVAEEIMPIQSVSVIVVKAPPYSVVFFHDLILAEMNEIPENLKYIPEVLDIVSEKVDKIQETEKKYEVDFVPDLSGELFPEITNIYGANIDKGIDVEVGGDEEEIPTDIFDTDLKDELYNSTPVVEEPDIFEGLDGTLGVKMESGEIPSFDEDFGTNETNNKPVEDSGIDNDFSVDDTFNEDLYNNEDTHEEVDTEEENIEPSIKEVKHKNKKEKFSKVTKSQERQTRPVDTSTSEVRALIDVFANRGTSIAVTGFGGSGTSTVAFNIANTLNSLGYSVLLVDFDMENRTQSYISKDNYDSLDIESTNLLMAINTVSGINTFVSVTKPGFHLLTVGLGAEMPENIHFDRTKLIRFTNLSKTSHNFVVYDLPFKETINKYPDILALADNVVINIASSNWGITKAILSMGNISDDDMIEILFERGQLLYNRYKGFNKMLGKKVRSALDIGQVMDMKILELMGEDPGVYFRTMRICGVINEDSIFEEGWYNSRQYSDTPKGQEQFIKLLKSILLKRGD